MWENKKKMKILFSKYVPRLVSAQWDPDKKWDPWFWENMSAEKMIATLHIVTLSDYGVSDVSNETQFIRHE